jgi:formylglycine-generating enzyme required for sulfatase activity
MVNWYGAITYCNKLSLLEDRELCYSVKDASENEIDWAGSVTIPTNRNDNWDAAFCDSTKNGYRLPYEAEWEYAARGGQKSQSKNGSSYDYDYAGDTEICKVGWYNDNDNKNTECANPVRNTYGTKPVKTKDPNELGLCDMSGNVFEWCQDWHRSSYQQNEPHGPSYRPSLDSYRVCRGGCWFSGLAGCRVSYRISSHSYLRDNDIGFRVACKGE